MDTKLQLGQIQFQPTKKDDLKTLLKMENNPDNTPYIRQWSLKKHEGAIDDSNIAHFTITKIDNNRIIGYVILIGIGDPENNLEFKRIVISEKGHGYGRDAVKLIKKYAFEQTDTHRLWLEVAKHNHRAFSLYESEGFILEGIHRESMKQNDNYISLNVMSILRQEHE
jgi:RimJ/RimL family protein N-acetyltransferase